MRLIGYLVCLYCLGCNSPQKPVVTPAKDTSAEREILSRIDTETVAKSIEDLQKFTWVAYHPDTTQYLCEMQFEKEFALNLFHGQCIYYFFTATTYAKNRQQVALLWTYKPDCLLDMSFLEKANGAKHHPKYGDEFAIYRLLDDKTLSVEYKFPEWVKKVNQIAKDSLFPQRLYLKNPYD